MSTPTAPAPAASSPRSANSGPAVGGPPPLRQRWQQAKNNPAARWLGKRAPTRTPRQERAHAVASGLLGLAAYAMFINGIRYGPSGVTGWLKAKFLNRPMQGFSVVAPNQPIVQQPTAPVSA